MSAGVLFYLKLAEVLALSGHVPCFANAHTVEQPRSSVDDHAGKTIWRLRCAVKQKAPLVRGAFRLRAKL